MNNRESEFGRKIAHYLDQATTELRPGTVYRLKQARAAAMANLAASPSAASEFAAAGIGNVSDGRSYLRGAVVRWLGVALFVAVAGFGYQQWRAMQQVYEFEDLDLHLLASDLPIDAYLDRGFQNWLRAGSER
jgi:hypothetical protein